MPTSRRTQPYAYGIADPYHPDEDFFGASGLQVWGTATVFKKSDDLVKFNEVRKYARYTEVPGTVAGLWEAHQRHVRLP